MAESLEKKVEKWQKNYYRWRKYVNKVFDCCYTVEVVGTIPKECPCILLPVHEYSIDPFALIKGIDQPISFIYTVDNPLKSIPMSILPSVGSIRTYVKGISAKKHKVRDFVLNHVPLINQIGSYYVAMPREKKKAHSRDLAQEISYRFDSNYLVVGFPQGDFQRKKVSKVKLGLVNFVSAYEEKTGTKVSIIPVGIEYHLEGKREESLIRLGFQWPPFGTKITLRFGEPQYINGRCSTEISDSVMKEAAKLSNLPYNPK